MVMFNFTNLTDMKKVFRIMGLCALVALAATSCKKEEQKLASSFKAELTQPTSDAKTHLSGSDLHWNSGDAIKVFDANGTAYMMSTTDNDVKEATFTSETTLDANESYTAFYPASGATKSGTEVLLDLPAVQTYAEGTFGNATYPMAATNTGTSFTFHSPCGLLAIPVKGTGNIGTIELTGKASENLAGQLRYNLNGEHQGLTNGQATVTLDCGNIALDATNATTFYFVVPAGVFANGFKAVLKNGTTELYTLETMQDNTIAAETIKLMPVVTVSAVAVTTNPIANVGYTDATVNGSYVAPTGMSVTEVGFHWGSNATNLDNTETLAAASTPFATTIDGLMEGTTYYYMAYAKNGENEYTGMVESFTTNSSIVAPTVTTAAATAITTTTATGGGEVTDNGGATVTQYGICWSTNENPTTDDSKLYSDGEPTGAFTFNMTGLTHNTTYHVRAYAVNSVGTAYGSDVTFTTVAIVAPTVTTSDIIDGITDATATCGGAVTANNGTLLGYGISYSTDATFATGSTEVAGSGISENAFTVNLTGLAGNTTFYFRAYATNEGGTGYGNVYNFTTLPTGIINSKFTINATGDQVYFSKGNLQYIGSAATPYWKFAENQWDYLGNNGQGSSSQTVDRDLFGWGTSGYNHGAIAYQPWTTEISNTCYRAYGSFSANLYDQTGQADWGYNAIANGGNHENSGWRTLTINEWDYILNSRDNAVSMKGYGTVNSVNGMILLPDDWTLPEGLNFTTGEGGWYNIYSGEQWAQMEANGAVFLPAGGYRHQTSFHYVGTGGRYYSSSRGNGDDSVYRVTFTDGAPTAGYGYSSGPHYGVSVRLVLNAE